MNSKDDITLFIVDDSAVFRSLWSRSFTDQDQIKVVGSAKHGQDALDQIMAMPKKPDVVLLDLEMPVLDGISTLPVLKSISPDTSIIVVSSFSTDGAKITLDALEAGAADFIPKPTELKSGEGIDSTIEKLRQKVLLLANKKHSILKPLPKNTKASAKNKTNQWEHPIEAIVIGSSTGGPSALVEVLSNLSSAIYQPILIVQHIPENFVGPLAERITKVSGRPCLLPKAGQVIEAGTIYLASNEGHMALKNQGSQVVVDILDTPPENFCRPAVDVLFRSAAPIFEQNLLSIVLTGMGEDGKKGAEVIKKHGGHIVVQDEPSSVVWGMPGAVALAQLEDLQLDLKQIKPYIEQLCGLEKAS
jgi:two-component system chemotaxis response regulator CheB